MTGINHTDNVSSIIFTSPSSEALKRLKVKVPQNVSDIIELPNDIDNQYVQLITDEAILEILRKKPTLWLDVQQKIRKYLHDQNEAKDNKEQQYEQTRNLVKSMISAFLIPEQNTTSAHDISGEELGKRIIHGIVKNKKLTDYIEYHTPSSFVEYPTHKLAKFKTPGQVFNLLNKIIHRNTGTP